MMDVERDLLTLNEAIIPHPFPMSEYRCINRFTLSNFWCPRPLECNWLVLGIGHFIDIFKQHFSFFSHIPLLPDLKVQIDPGQPSYDEGYTGNTPGEKYHLKEGSFEGELPHNGHEEGEDEDHEKGVNQGHSKRHKVVGE